jgi:hypothetical protein
MFHRGSRYYSNSYRTHEDENGTTYRYVARRLIPRRAGPLAASVRLDQAERLDLVAERSLGDPSKFWRLCDVNAVLDPFALNVSSGRLLDVPE